MTENSETKSSMGRILFVDDDTSVLRALERMITVRNDWTAVTVSNGQKALTELERECYDVIIADVDMPQMTGTELLGLVQDRHPDVIRIHLSGSSDPTSALRAVPVAHQYLAKPLERDHLYRVIDQAACLRRLLQTPTLRKLVGASDELPAAPTMYLELRQCLSREDATFADVAKVVERDSAMCATMLKLVNSAFFGSPKQVSNITEAVSYLGIARIKELVLTLGVIQMFQAARSLTGFSIGYLQRHSMMTALIARNLDKELNGDDVAMSGMLHELGQLLLASRRPDLYGKVLRAADDRPLQEVEREVMGASHAEVGGYLLGVWGLPATIVEAVAYHHEPSQSAVKGFGVPQALYIADRLAAEVDGPSADVLHGVHDELDEDYLEEIGVGHKIALWRERAQKLAETISSSIG